MARIAWDVDEARSYTTVEALVSALQKRGLDECTWILVYTSTGRCTAVFQYSGLNGVQPFAVASANFCVLG